MSIDKWPALPLNEWKETYTTLHMWTQIVGKIRLSLTPLINHYWNVTLYVTPRGLTTSSITYDNKIFAIDFDFIDHHLKIVTSEGVNESIPLVPQATADFYRTVLTTFDKLSIDIKINPLPCEVPNPIPFDKDYEHCSYDRGYVERFHQILIQVDKVFKDFRSNFIGKCSPVHFFWGSFDLAVTRFSGRVAPPRPEADAITRESYSREVISHGFWPGSGAIQAPAFYSYTAPAPNGLDKQPIKPSTASWNKEMSEFILLYDDIRKTSSPENDILLFLQSTYDAGANLAKWDSVNLERDI